MYDIFVLLFLYCASSSWYQQRCFSVYGDSTISYVSINLGTEIKMAENALALMNRRMRCLIYVSVRVNVWSCRFQAVQCDSIGWIGFEFAFYLLSCRNGGERFRWNDPIGTLRKSLDAISPWQTFIRVASSTSPLLNLVIIKMITSSSALPGVRLC